ncbi:hypothetical protein FSP39_010914 [Pinctada imbricata]|uniref:Uncharacterized protein n=1 Tax=Pinctada imbricata TaxID=66713 RepID=A0AA88Y4A8_PINIB|nr:hypothetical protein FSP39_010914 [Pinctada imbricata]
MASKIEPNALRIVSENYAKLFSDKDNSKGQTPRPKTSEKEFLEQLHKQMFTGGVRAPLLADVQANFNCKFDFVQSPRSIFHKRQKTDLGLERKHSILPLETEKSVVSFKSAGSCPKIFKFLLPNGSVKDYDEIPEGADRDEWDRWRELVAQKKDARDILYKNTFCTQKLRYRMLTLPRISPDGRPRTSGEVMSKKPMVLKENTDMDSFVVPQPKRSYGTLKKIPQRKIDALKDKRIDFLEVRRIKSNFDASKGRVEQYTTHVNQPVDVFHLTEIPGINKNERPLKYENWKHRVSNQGVIRHYIQVPAIPRFGESREKSAQAYKNYLESSHAKQNEQTNQVKPLEKENTEMSMYGYENRMLQSVIDVNKPETKSDDKTKTDAANEPAAADDASPGEPPNNETKSLGGDNNIDTNRSNKSSKSIIVEIKPTWNETHEDIPEQQSSIHEQQSRAEELVHPVPANSPLPDEGIDMEEPEDFD